MPRVLVNTTSNQVAWQERNFSLHRPSHVWHGRDLPLWLEAKLSGFDSGVVSTPFSWLHSNPTLAVFPVDESQESLGISRMLFPPEDKDRRVLRQRVLTSREAYRYKSLLNYPEYQELTDLQSQLYIARLLFLYTIRFALRICIKHEPECT